MPGSTLYATADEVRDYLRANQQNSSVDVLQFDLALDSACREIDAYCGRSFHQQVLSDESATARLYRPSSPTILRVDDLWTATDLVIKTDEDDDGTFETTWASTDYELEPLDGYRQGLPGWPYWKIRAVDSRSFPHLNRRASVQVTAKWGWAAIPDPVKRVTLVLTAAALKVRDAPLGIAGMGDFGAVRVPMDQYRMIAAALRPYRRADRTLQVA